MNIAGEMSFLAELAGLCGHLKVVTQAKRAHEKCERRRGQVVVNLAHQSMSIRFGV